MFEGVETGIDDGGAKRAAVSTGVSLAVYGLIGATLIAVGGSLGAKAVAKEEPVRVSFKAPAPKLEPPPPPPPPKQQKKKPTTNRQKQSSRPPMTPTIVGDEILAEGDERDFRASATPESLAEIGASLGDGSDIAAFMSDAPALVPPSAPVAVNLDSTSNKPVFVKDNGKRPIARAGNRLPAFPRSARKRGREGEVVLRFVVTAEGTVESIEVLSGDEPFLSAAIAAVQEWRYSPAVVDGRRQPAYQRVRIPFRLKSA